MFSPVRGSNAILCLAVLAVVAVATVGGTVAHLGAPDATTEAAVDRSGDGSASAYPLRVRTWATLDDAQAAIDAGGIVAFDFGHGVALGQHEHLGGARNIAARRIGSFVRVTGTGSVDGTYRVAENVLAQDMDEADLGRIARGRLVAYTCVGRSDNGIRQVIALEPVRSA